MTSGTHRIAATSPSWRGAHGVGISQTVLVACVAFGPCLPADAVARAIARGLQDGGLPEPDVCSLPGPGTPTVERDVRALLDALDFDVRMRAARAVVIGARRLEERALAGSLTFEIATRARQGGIPAYAVTGENALEAFDARILDLQLVMEAGSRTKLAAAGFRLSEIA